MNAPKDLNDSVGHELLDLQRNQSGPRDADVEAVVGGTARGSGGIVSRSGREPHVPVLGSRDLRDVGFVAAHEPSELPSGLRWGLLRSTRTAAPSACGSRGGRTPGCPRGRARDLPWVGESPSVSRRSSSRRSRPEPFLAGTAVIQRRPMVTRWHRPAGLECLAPRGRDRRCRTRSADGCSPAPTHRTPGRSSRPGSAAPPSTWGKTASKSERGLFGEVLDVLLEVTVEDGEEARDGCARRAPNGRSAASQESPTLRRPRLEWTSRPASEAKPCRRDLMVMYVSKGVCKVLPVKPAARAHALMSCTDASS